MPDVWLARVLCIQAAVRTADYVGRRHDSGRGCPLLWYRLYPHGQKSILTMDWSEATCGDWFQVDLPWPAGPVTEWSWQGLPRELADAIADKYSPQLLEMQGTIKDRAKRGLPMPMGWPWLLLVCGPITNGPPSQSPWSESVGQARGPSGHRDSCLFRDAIAESGAARVWTRGYELASGAEPGIFPSLGSSARRYRLSGGASRTPVSSTSAAGCCLITRLLEIRPKSQSFARVHGTPPHEALQMAPMAAETRTPGCNSTLMESWSPAIILGTSFSAELLGACSSIMPGTP